MFNEGYSFPHPVLGNEDDISGDFNLSVQISRTETRQILFDNIKLDLTNPYIKSLVDHDKAGCFIKAYCSSTLKTWIFELTGRFELEEDDVANKIDLQASVIAKKDIVDYSDATFNPEYGNSKFMVNPHEVLGTSGTLTLPIPKVNEKLGLGNIFQFNALKDQNPIEFEVERDKIFINYPVTHNGEHPPNMLFKKAPWTAVNIFIIPALAEALQYMASFPEEASKWEWFTVVDQLLPTENRTGNHFRDAQRVISGHLPVLSAYDELMK